MSSTVYFPDNENFKNRNFPMIHRLMRDLALDAYFDAPPKAQRIRYYLTKKGLRHDLQDIIVENRFFYNIDLFEIIEFEFKRKINIRSLDEELIFDWSEILNENFQNTDKDILKELAELLNEARLMIEYYRETLFVKKPFLVFVFGKIWFLCLVSTGARGTVADPPHPGR